MEIETRHGKKIPHYQGLYKNGKKKDGIKAKELQSQSLKISNAEHQHHLKSSHLYSDAPWDAWHKYMGNPIPNQIKILSQPKNIWYKRLRDYYYICNSSSATLENKCIKDQYKIPL